MFVLSTMLGARDTLVNKTMVVIISGEIHQLKKNQNINLNNPGYKIRL